MLQHYIEIIKPHIIKLFKSDSTGHDISHLVRTMNIAVNLCEKENGDSLIVGISAFMLLDIFFVNTYSAAIFWLFTGYLVYFLRIQKKVED